MAFNLAEFSKSSSKISECPPANHVEFAFIGRSNVGKSTLINTLCNRKSLAKTSSKPGKTKLINHFIIDKSWYLVDLPGYGFASVSKSERLKWSKMSEHYLLHRESLACTFILIDSRVPPQKIDLDFINWMGTSGLPFTIVLTKIDKISNSKYKEAMDKFIAALEVYWEEIPHIIATSSEKKLGIDILSDFIIKTFEEVKGDLKPLK